MKQILHILRKSDDAYPLEVIRKQAESCDVMVILDQDAIGVDLPDTNIRVRVLSKEESYQDPPRHPSPSHIGPKELIENIFACDTVVTW